MASNIKTDLDLFVIQKVRKYRIENKFSQVDLAIKLGVSPGFIGKVESHKNPAKYNLAHINKLADIFNCSPKDFLPDKHIKITKADAEKLK
jgi:transcriptional regulator with XRE-family HTH domain